MKRIVVLVVIVVVNVLGYMLLTRPAVVERSRLESRLDQREGDLKVSERQAEFWGRLQRIADQAGSVVDPGQWPAPGDFAVLREVILEAEKGLAITHQAVEFRPEVPSPAGFRGVRIRATERGDFFSLWAFLERVSRWKGPLTPVELTVVEDAGRLDWLLLDVTWLGLWPEDQRAVGLAPRPGGSDPPTQRSVEALAHLESWLQRARREDRMTVPKRDIFRRQGNEPGPPVAPPVASPSLIEASPLELVGFIFSGGGGRENPVAAIRFEGRMWLVGPGDSVGSYRVEALVVGEGVRLVDRASGETVRLYLN